MAQLKDLLVLGSSRFIGDIFANNLQAFRITDHLIPIEDETYDLGSSSLKWNNIYAKNTYADGQTLQELILQRSTTADNAFNAVNPRITFKNGDGSQSAQLIFTDYDTVTNPSSQALSPVSLTLRANSGEAQFVVPRLRVGGYINNSYTFSAESAIINSWIRTVGTTGWYSETYGGGWYMSDNTWIRSYGNKSIYHNQGTLRTDGTFQVGDNGKYVNLSNSGFKFGDTAAASANNLLTVNGHLLIEPAYNTNNSYNEGLRINRSTTGYANVTLGGVKGSLTGTGNGVWWIGTLSAPANDTTAASSLTGSNFYISHASSTGASTRLQGHWSSTATNSQGFSIWPRLGINDNPNNDYTLYVNGNVLTEGYLQLGTSSQSAAPSNKGIRVHDLRSVSFTPDTFGDYNVQFYFDDAGGRGSSWSTIMHLKGWTGAYAAHQLSFNAHNNTTNVNLYHRSGIGNTWGNWIGIADSNNVSWAAWTAGTTAGPKANLVVAGVTKTSDAIPSASQTASGIVTTGTQNFQGRKRFGNITFRAYNDSGTANQWPGDVFLENNAGTRVGEYWYDTGNATNITKGQFYWRQYSPNSTADTATTGFYETYSLPNVASGLTENKSYSILTTKSLVSVAQGGTGKSSWTPWGIIYASAATTLAQVTAGADTEYNNKYQFLMSNGAAAPVWRTAFNIDSGPNLPVLANESDLNSLTTPGVYVVRDSTAMKTIVNNPLGANAGSGGRIITMGGYTTTANSYQWQFVFTAGGSPQFRNRANTTWNGWRTFVHSTTNTAIGSTSKPVYIKADGTAAEVSYSISATLNAGVTPHMAYYSGNNTIDDTDNLRYLNINSTTTTNRTSAGTIRGIQISGTCYGNDAAYLNSTTAGDFSLGDPGPQIQFGSSDGAAKAAIIYTNHDSNGLGGSSFQFVSDENPINLVAGGFVARTRAIVGQRSLDTNYIFRVTGTTYLGGDVTLDGNSAILRTGKSISWNQAHQYAMIRMTTQSGWSPLWAMKANTGWWTMGHYNSGAFNDQLLFGFLADVDTSGTSGAKNHLDFTVRLLPQVYASGTDTTADRAFVISTYDGTNKALKGSATKPVYVDSQGVVTETTYSLGATVNGGTTPYVAYYSGNNAISSAKDVTTMIMPSHYYHAMYSNASTGTEVYVHYYNGGISSTNTNANLRVKNGSSYNVFRICGAGEATWDGTQIRATNGLLASTKNSNTVTIGSQNASYTHIYNSASIPFIFNNSVLTTTGNLGNSAYPWNNLYIGKTDTKGIYYVGTKSTNRMITFVDNTADEYGNGIKIGGGGLVVIGSGESSNVDIAAGTENTYILADGTNYIESNANTLANRIGFAVNGSGNIIPVKVEANNNLLQDIGADGAAWKGIYSGNIYLRRQNSVNYGRISFYQPSYVTWISYMSNSAAGACPTGGQPSTTTEVTSWAQRSLIENGSGYGWIWEAAANTAQTTNTVKPTARMSLSSNTGRLRIEANASTTTNENGSLIVSSALNGSSGNVAIELWRGNNASWMISNEAGTLHFRNNWTTAVQTTYSVDAVQIAYNTGILTALKGITTTGTGIAELSYNSRTITPHIYATGPIYASNRIETNTYFLNNVSNTSGGFYLYGNNAQYGRFFIGTLGTANSGDGNATQGAQGEVYLYVGNATARPASGTAGGANNARGRIRLYGTGAAYTDILPQAPSNQNFWLPNYGGAMYAVHAENNNAVGSAHRPVFVDTNGRVKIITALTIEEGNIWSGGTSQTAERDIGVVSAAGQMYMYAQGTSGGNRGIYLAPHGTGGGKNAFLVDTNNNVTFYGNLSGNATSSSYVKLYEARTVTTDMNKAANYVAAGAMFHLIASSSTTTGKPSFDANVLQMNWDNNGGYDAQLAISTSDHRMQIRSRASTGEVWREVPTIAAATQTGSATLPVYVSNTGKITACTASNVFSAMSWTGGTLSITVAGQGRTASVPEPTSGAWYGTASKFPLVHTDGVMEIGKYIDFHTSGTSTADYDFRLTCTANGALTVSGNLTIGGTLILSSTASTTVGAIWIG